MSVKKAKSLKSFINLLFSLLWLLALHEVIFFHHKKCFFVPLWNSHDSNERYSQKNTSIRLKTGLNCLNELKTTDKYQMPRTSQTSFVFGPSITREVPSPQYFDVSFLT